jgi:hypothetical protein
MTIKKTLRKKPPPPTLIRTLAFTEEDTRVLAALAQEASDWLGRPASGSAVVRALLRYAAQQPVAWQRTALFELMRTEIFAGTTWGGKRSGISS